MILFRESAFYVPATTLKTELHRYAAFLDDAGVFIVRMSGAIKAARTIERMIEENFRVVEKQKIESLPATILVFR